MNHDKELRNPWLRLEAAVFSLKSGYLQEQAEVDKRVYKKV